ncbi:MAG: hypothetical protein MUC49_12835 [Raineya sp.]|jgi:hypothetical protein|nr:hypothetical protein [Raineya sp.]
MKKKFYPILFAFLAGISLVTLILQNNNPNDISFTIDNDTNSSFEYCTNAYRGGGISNNTTRSFSYDEGTSFYYCAGDNRRELFKVNKSIEGKTLRVSNLLR